MSDRELIVVPGVGNPDLYAGASVHEGLVWTSGQVPARDGDPMPEGFDEQMTLVLDNLERTLEAAGAGLDTVLKANGYLVTLDDFKAYNELYIKRFSPHGLPPRTTVEVVRFPPPMLIELEVVAHVR